MMSTDGKTVRGAVSVALAVLFALWGSVAPGAEVTSADGGDATGTFRNVVGSAGDNVAIDFAPDVGQIVLSGPAANNAARGLIITGRLTSAVPSGSFATAIADAGAMLAAEAANGENPADYVRAVDAEVRAVVASLSGGLRPETILDGGANGFGILRLGAEDAGAGHSLANLEFTRGNISISGESSLTYPNLKARAFSGGGAVFIGDVNDLWFHFGVTTDHSLSGLSSSLFSANSAQAEGGTWSYTNQELDDRLYLAHNDPDTVDMGASAFGGAVFAGGVNGEVKDNLFIGNSAIATGGSAELRDITIIGTNKTDLDVFGDLYTGANAYGGGMHVGGDVTAAFSGTVFSGNTAVATGGDAVASGLRGGNGAVNEVIDNGFVYMNASVDAGVRLFGDVWAGGGGLNVGGDIGAAFSGNLFSDNSAVATGGTATAHDFQGGNDVKAHADSTDAYADAYAYAYANADVYANATAIALGGGVAASIISGEFSNNLFAGNSVVATGGTLTIGDVRGGSDAQATATSTGVMGAVAHAYAHTSGLAGGGATATAAGGGMCVQVFDAADVSGNIFSGNSAVATGGKVSISGVRAGQGAQAGTTVNGAILPGEPEGIVEISAFANASAIGGGLYANSLETTIEGGVFIGNRAVATGGTITIADMGDPEKIATFLINADAYAFGGALNVTFADPMTNSGITDSRFWGNIVQASAEGDVYWLDADGGIVRGAAKAYARGGAMFFDTVNFVNPTTATLSATANKELVIGANLAIDSAAARYDGIHFGSGMCDPFTGSFYFSSGYTHALNIDVGAGGRVLMYDPVTATLFNDDKDAAFAITKVGTGSAGLLYWGGLNVLDANGGSTVTFEDDSGHTTFAYDFTLTTTPDIDYRVGSVTNAYATVNMEPGLAGTNLNGLTVGIGGGGGAAAPSFGIVAARPSDLALFDFTNATNAGVAGAFDVRSAGAFELDVERQLVSVDGRYLIAAGVNAGDLAAATDPVTGLKAGGAYITGFTAEGDKLWANASYESEYQARIDANANLASSADALNMLVNDHRVVSDSQFKEIIGDLEATNPGHILNMAETALRASTSFADAAVAATLIDPFRKELYPATAAVSAPNAFASPNLSGGRGIRFWTGYLGDFRRYSSHSGSKGHRSSVNGFVAGLNYDFGASASLGVYGGYARGRDKGRDHNSRIDGDFGHFGLVGRVSPVRCLPDLALLFDAGVTLVDNDARRQVGSNRVSGSFDQKVYSGALQARYDFEVAPALLLTPFASVRYSRLDQDGVDESGLTSTRVDGFDADSFVSRLGVELSRSIPFCGGLLTPTLSAAWRHEWGDRDYSSTAFYQGMNLNPHLPATAFAVSSSRGDRDSADIGAALRAGFDVGRGHRLGVNVSYNFNVSSHTRAHSLYAGVEIGF